MKPLEEGDRVRVDIPDTIDPDFQYHGRHGEVVTILPDDAGEISGEPKDSDIYRVRLENGEKVDLRRRDLRPPIEE